MKELLGHKDIKMTLRYAHLSSDHKKQAVALLDKTAPKVTTIFTTGANSTLTKPRQNLDLEAQNT